MTHTIQQMPQTSPAFRQALLRSEKKRIVGVIVFVAFFSVLAIVRIYVLGSAMSRSGLVVSALVIAFELGLYRAVNQSLHSGQSVSNFLWYGSSILECLFPAVGENILTFALSFPSFNDALGIRAIAGGSCPSSSRDTSNAATAWPSRPSAFGTGRSQGSALRAGHIEG
jgi:hypothetical protein